MSGDCPGVFRDPLAPARAAGAPPLRALFLDRDGVVNVDHGYVHAAAETRFLDGLFPFCATARAAGLALVVVTNQAGVGRGLYTEETLRRYTRWVHGEFARRGVPLLATYWCPHHPSAGRGPYLRDCPCRKPRPGMLLQARDDHGIDLAASLLVGDKDGDLEAARAAGVGRMHKLGAGGFAAASRDLGLAGGSAAADTMTGSSA